MFFLLVAPLFYAGFSLGIRSAQRQDADLYAVGATNYATAALFYAVLYASHPVPMDRSTVWLGLVVGVLYALGFFMIVPAMRERGVSIVVALLQLSVLVPTGASVLVWGESPTAMKAAGAGLCLLAMPLLALDKGATQGRLARRTVMCLAALFVIGGLSQSGLKWFDELAAPEQTRGFFLSLFSAATVTAGLVWTVARKNTDLRALRWGSLVGMSNAGAGLTLITALRFYPGYVVFPLVQALSLVTVVTVAMVAWREIPGKLGLAGICLAVIAGVVINL